MAFLEKYFPFFGSANGKVWYTLNTHKIKLSERRDANWLRSVGHSHSGRFSFGAMRQITIINLKIIAKSKSMIFATSFHSNQLNLSENFQFKEIASQKTQKTSAGLEYLRASFFEGTIDFLSVANFGIHAKSNRMEVEEQGVHPKSSENLKISKITFYLFIYFTLREK